MPAADPYAAGPEAQPHAGYPAPGGFDPGALETTLILPQIGGGLPDPGAGAELHPPSGYFHAVSIGDTDFGGLPSGTFGGADGFGSGAGSAPARWSGRCPKYRAHRRRSRTWRPVSGPTSPRCRPTLWPPYRRPRIP
ncbi:hypothetical protein ACU686_06760 [Yinghuangia aomiensis]